MQASARNNSQIAPPGKAMQDMNTEEKRAYVEYVRKRGTERTSLSPVKGKDPWTAKPIAIVAEPLKLAP